MLLLALHGECVQPSDPPAAVHAWSTADAAAQLYLVPFACRPVRDVTARDAPAPGGVSAPAAPQAGAAHTVAPAKAAAPAEKSKGPKMVGFHVCHTCHAA